MKILFLVTTENANFYIGKSVFRALKRNPLVERVKMVNYHTALTEARRTKFDALIAFDGQEANNFILRKLCQLVPKRAIWFVEDPYELETNLKISSCFDIVFTNSPDCVKHYEKPANYLPLAADLANCVERRSVDKKYDIFFAGTAWPNRLKFIDSLRKARPKLRWKLILTSNPALDPHIRSYQSSFKFSEGVSIADFTSIAESSLITLMLPRRFSTSGDPHQSSPGPGPRLFELALAGTCQLADNSSMPVTDRFYEADKHYIPFASKESCLTAIDHLLADESKIFSIAEASRRHTIENHLYDNRCNFLLQKVLQIENPPSLTPAQSTSVRRVLFIAHNVVSQGHFGGSEIYLDELLAGLPPSFEPYVLTHDPRSRFGQVYHLLDRKLSCLRSYNLATPFDDTMLLSTDLERILQEVVAAWSIDIVHFNHLIGFPPSLVRFAKSLGCPVFFTIHDYYLACDSYTLLNERNIFCHTTFKNEDICNACTYKRRGFLPGSQAKRRRFMREMAADIDVFIAGSASSAKIIEGLMPGIDQKIILMPPAMPSPRSKPLPAGNSFTLKVAIPGNFAANKGASLALEIFSRTAGKLPIHFHIFGRIGDCWHEPLSKFIGRNVTVHGAYARGQLPDAFFECQVSLILSNWPETYCMVLSEVWAAGQLPIVSNFGALAERVRDGVDGFIAHDNSAGGFLAILDTLTKSPDTINALRSNIPSRPYVGAEDYTLWLSQQYSQHLSGLPKSGPSPIGREISRSEIDIYITSHEWTVQRPGPAAAPSVSPPQPAPPATPATPAAQPTQKPAPNWHTRLYRKAKAAKRSILYRIDRTILP
jgi:glycosyltransferase involved in cell wall biosynthesis